MEKTDRDAVIESCAKDLDDWAAIRERHASDASWWQKRYRQRCEIEAFAYRNAAASVRLLAKES